MSPSLKTHFLSLYSMALSDAEFHETEMLLLYELGNQRGIPKEEIDQLILNAATAPVIYPVSTAEKIEYLYDYARLILADGVVQEDERKTLEKFCLRFQFANEHVPVIAELLIEAARKHTPVEEVLNFVNQN